MFFDTANNDPDQTIVAPSRYQGRFYNTVAAGGIKRNNSRTCPLLVAKTVFRRRTIAFSYYYKIPWISGLPNGDPLLRIEKMQYAVGDTVRGNCTVPSGNPPANVTWTVNGTPVG